MFLVRSNHNANVVCAFSRGPRITHFLGIDGGQLAVMQEQNDKFDNVYYRTPLKNGEEYTSLQFALAYTRTEAARKLIPITPSAFRVLTAIIRGQMPEGDDDNSTTLEKIMAAAKEEAGFKKPDGPVAQVHKFLDKKIDAIKAGTVSRRELIDAMMEKNIAEGTAVTQAGVWARNNGVVFARPSQAKEALKEKRSAAKKPKAAKAAKPKADKAATAAAA
jgi:hypothetical protein